MVTTVTTPALVVVDSSVTGALDPVLLVEALREALAGVGLRGVTDGELIGVLGRDCHVALDDIAASRGLRGPDALQAVRFFAARTVRDLAERRHPTAAAAGEALVCLKTAAIPCVLVSDLPSAVVEALLLRHGWRGLLHTTVPIERAGSERPAPDIIHAAMASVGIRDPSKVANVGGHWRHLEAGSAAGVGWNVAIGWTAPSGPTPPVDAIMPDLHTATQRLLTGSLPRTELSATRRRSSFSWNQVAEEGEGAERLLEQLPLAVSLFTEGRLP